MQERVQSLGTCTDQAAYSDAGVSAPKHMPRLQAESIIRGTSRNKSATSVVMNKQQVQFYVSTRMVGLAQSLSSNFSVRPFRGSIARYAVIRPASLVGAKVVSDLSCPG